MRPEILRFHFHSIFELLVEAINELIVEEEEKTRSFRLVAQK